VARLKSTRQSPEENISQDGKLLGLVGKSGAFVYAINGTSEGREIKPFHTRFKHEHVEGCCFVPDGLLATAETREIFLSLIRRSIQPNNSTSEAVTRRAD